MLMKKIEQKWRTIIGNQNFQIGDHVKFKWGDLRYSKPRYGARMWRDRKTWCYGTVAKILSEGDGYIVAIDRGSPCIALHTQGEVLSWAPRRKRV